MVEWRIDQQSGSCTRIDGKDELVVGSFADGVLTMNEGCGKYALPLRKKLKQSGTPVTECINPDPRPVAPKPAPIPEGVAANITRATEPKPAPMELLDERMIPDFYENKPDLTPLEKRKRSELIQKKKTGAPMTKAEQVAYEALQIGFWPYQKVGLSRNKPGTLNSGMQFKIEDYVAALVIGSKDPYPDQSNCPEGDISWQYGSQSPRARDWVMRNLGPEEYELRYNGVPAPVVDGSWKMGFDPNAEDHNSKEVEI